MAEEKLPLSLTQASRDALRAKNLEGRFYSPWVHLGITSVLGLAAIGAAVSQLHGVKWWQVAFGAGLWVLANATEWRIHKTLLHHRTPGFAVLYEQHTPMHHMIYLTDDMEIRSTREFKLVLMPPYAIALVFVGLSPLIAALWFGWPVRFLPEVDQHNVAAVFTLVTMGFVVSYEWLHLAYHLPKQSFVGRLGFIRFLARTHAVHHHPSRMNKWNFNVTVPLWDVVRGTYLRDEHDPRAVGERAEA
jgi:hypothetical protein